MLFVEQDQHGLKICPRPHPLYFRTYMHTLWVAKRLSFVGICVFITDLYDMVHECDISIEK